MPRKATLFFALGLVAVLAGCSGKTSAEGGGTSPGTGGTGGTGGGAGGSSGDASTPTPTSWPVHVEVVGNPAGAPALAVLISRPDGSEESVTETDANGKVDVDVPHLGSVTVFHTAAASASGATVKTVNTYARVDEEVTFRVEALDSSGVQPVLADTLTFEVDAATLPAGADRVVVQLPCEDAKESSGGPTNPIVFDSPDGCPGATEYYVVALALDAAGHGLAATVLPHLPLATGAMTHTLSFDYATFVELEPEILPADPATDDVGIEVWGTPPGDTYGKYAYAKSKHGLTHPVGAQKLLLPVVVDFFTKFSVQGSIWHPDVPGALAGRVDERFLTASTLPASFGVEADIAPIASISNQYGDLVERPSVSFSLEPGALGNCISARLGWLHSSTVILWRWTQKVTSSGGFEVPVLPANLAGYSWQLNDSFMNWGSGVSHLKKVVPCADLLAADVEYRSAQGI